MLIGRQTDLDDLPNAEVVVGMQVRIAKSLDLNVSAEISCVSKCRRQVLQMARTNCRLRSNRRAKKRTQPITRIVEI